MLSIFLSPVFALSSEQSGRIIENFKQQEQKMIFESDTLDLDKNDRNIFNNYKKLSLYSSLGDKISGKREYLELQNQKLEGRINSLQSALIDLESDISNLAGEIDLINDRVIETKRKIETNTQTIDLLKNKIEESSVILHEYIVYLYKKGRSVSSDNEIDNLKTIIVSGENIDDLMNDLYFKSIIQLTGQQLIVKHRDYISRLYIKQLELSEDEQELKALRKRGIIEKSVLDDKKAAKKRLLEATKGQEALYKKYIDEKLEKEKNIKVKELREQIKINNTKRKLLEKHDCNFIDLAAAVEADIIGLSDKCLGINKVIYAESRLTGVDVGNNPFDWPVSPYLWISAFFDDAQYKEQFWTEHEAIDIIIPQGTDIRAPMDGYVLYIEPPVDAWYAYIALKHGDGLVSLYGHVHKSFVRQYDFVKAGDVFAQTGWEYGTLGAGLLSSWPHLHFVVYKDGRYVDPLTFLDLSYLSYNKLPEKYEFKFVSDFRVRKGYEFTWARQKNRSGIFRIEGDTEVQRQKYLLDLYAVGVFQDWNIWVEEAISANIDPTFLMCVWLAETSLGKHLKTPFNVGNVGNTDSGSTYSFSNARQWVHWMTKTFNNRYLSQYTTIDQLSRYGNKDSSKPIYASSDFNWHNNILKCMSHIKGHFLPDNTSFRLYSQ